MDNKKILYVVLALIVGVGAGYAFSAQNIRNTDQGAAARTSSVSDMADVSLKEAVVADIVADSDLKEAQKLAAESCAQSSRKYVKVLSPNGGEVFLAGQVIPVEWITCGYGSGTVMISLYSSILNTHQELAITADDGQEMVTIPTFLGQGNPPITSGNYYKIGVSPGGNPNLRDLSDNFFTIKTNKYLPGCTSYVGYSAANGLPCNTSGSTDLLCVAGGVYSSSTGLACNPSKNTSLYTSFVSSITSASSNPGNLNDVGTFVIKFNVTAWNGDIYIPKTAGVGGINFAVDMSGASEYGGLSSAITCNSSSCVSTPGNRFRINSGNTQSFTLTVQVNNASTINGAGFYRTVLGSIPWGTSDTAPYVGSYIPINIHNYITPYLYLN